MFCIDEASGALGRPALSWPSLSLCTDNGPDLIAGLLFLTRHAGMVMNIDFAPDINHLAWNAAKRALKSARLWGHQLLMLLNFIMRHGPYNQSARLQQCREGFEEYLVLAEPSQCPLFLELLPRLLRDRGRGHELTRPGIAEEVWEELRQRRAWAKAGTPVNLNRWFALIQEGREDDQHWHERYMGQLYTCLGCDLMHGKRFQEMLEGRGQSMRLNTVEGERSQMKDHTAESRALRNSCANLLVVSTMSRAGHHNQDIERMVVAVLEPLESWVGTSNAELRSAHASLPWVQKQLSGAFFGMLMDTWRHMRSWGSLMSFGFLAGSKRMQDQISFEDPMIADRFQGEVVVQVELATQLGDLCINLGLEVTQSWLWMLIGWPQGAVLWLGPDAQAEVAQFLQDAEAFEKLQALVLGGATELRDLHQRSIFQLRPVQQLLRALRERDGQVTEDLKAFLVNKFARFMQSQLAEDGFNISRRVETLALNKKAPVHTLCHKMFTYNMLAKRHSFDEVQGSYISHRIGLNKFPEEAFKHPVKPHPQDPLYADISTGSTKTDWWKSKSNTLPAVYADLALLRMTFNEGVVHASDLPKRWLSVLLRGSQLVKRLSHPVMASDPDCWYFALGCTGFSMLALACSAAQPPWMPCWYLLHPSRAGKACLRCGGRLRGLGLLAICVEGPVMAIAGVSCCGGCWSKYILGGQSFCHNPAGQAHSRVSSPCRFLGYWGLLP